MISVLSPAKTLDMGRSTNGIPLTMPQFQAETAPLIKKLRGFGPRKLSKLMKISSDLAKTNVARYDRWSEDPSADQVAAALLAFSGDVYRGMENHTLESEDLAFANDGIRVLSGMYGLLKPLDAIQPHRLEMGTSINVGRKKNLYEYWRPRVTKALSEELSKQKHQVLINLASNEYSKVIDGASLNAKVITPVFKDLKGGEYKVVMTWAKLARGMMARYIIDHRIENPEDLKGFEPYTFDEGASDESFWIFTRTNSGD